MEILNAIFPFIAWGVCILLLSIPGLFAAVFVFSLLGHLAQLISKKANVEN